MDINFTGYNETVITFIADGTLKEGVSGIVVKVTASGTVGKANEDDIFLGVLLSVRNGYASVQTSGYVKVNTASKIPVGAKILSADSEGGVYATEKGRQCFVLDSTPTQAGILI